MRVLMIYDGDYPWDVRVEKMLGSFTQAGHRVTLLARNKAGRARAESELTGDRVAARYPAAYEMALRDRP